MTYLAAIAAALLIVTLGSSRQASYGKIVMWAALVWAIILALPFLVDWNGMMAASRAWQDAMIAELNATAPGEASDRDAIVREQMTWLRDHYGEVCLGSAAGISVVGACCLVSLAAARRRKRGRFAPTGSFREMRTPEWMVWVVIAVAGLWFLDHYHPNTLARLISWNAAVVLASIYWLNGLSILAYAVNALRPSPFVVAMGVLTLVFFGTPPILSLIGLFDTWFNFRQGLARIARERAAKPSSGGEA